MEHHGSSDNTTGNAYGVKNMGSFPGDYVAGIWDKNISNIANIYNAADKYKNVYTSETSIPGDATLETRGWKRSVDGTFVSDSSPVFWRVIYIQGAGYKDGGRFCFYGGNGNAYHCFGSRAAVVCGSGL